MAHALESLLDDFSKFPVHVEPPPTFMEVAGYPHRQNVCSNILAFFLDLEGAHGLGSFVLDALTNVGNRATANDGAGGNVSIEREVITDRGNRIDILIESDAHAILIENKICAVFHCPPGRITLVEMKPQDARVGMPVKVLEHHRIEERRGLVGKVVGRYGGKEYIVVDVRFVDGRCRLFRPSDLEEIEAPRGLWRSLLGKSRSRITKDGRS